MQRIGRLGEEGFQRLHLGLGGCACYKLTNVSERPFEMRPHSHPLLFPVQLAPSLPGCLATCLRAFG